MVQSDERNQALTPRQNAFLKRLSDAEARLQAAIEGLEEKVLCTETVDGDWTVKDILGHIVSWNEEFRVNIAAILAGRHPGFDYQISGEDNFSASNQVWIEQKRDRTLAQILAEVEADYAAAAALIRGLTPVELRLRGVTPWKKAAFTRPEELSKEDTDSVETLVTFHWRHMNEHCRQIERWRRIRG